MAGRGTSDVRLDEVHGEGSRRRVFIEEEQVAPRFTLQKRHFNTVAPACKQGEGGYRKDTRRPAL